MQSIRDDYDSSYFVSGEGDMSAYAPDCIFSDPFVSFRGVGRFKQNVGNLGKLMKDIQLDVFEWQESGGEVVTRWRFSCVLDLPWKPRLAAAGGTTHVLDPVTNRVVQHIERWEVEPAKVVAQLLRPTAKVPTNRWETFLMAAGDGDAAGMWFVLSPYALQLSLPIIGVSLATKAVTGEGLPGVALGAVEGLAYLAFVAAAVAEVLKLAQSVKGES